MNRLLASSLLIAFIVSGTASARFQQKNLQPEPADKESNEGQLKRYRGQTKFLNATQSFANTRGGVALAGARSNKSAADSMNDPRRAQQESDVFKVGKPGSKLLYLLNDVRGLQVVSYAAGVTAPKLLGRAAATGNYSDQMYYDAARDRLVVLERMYFDESGNYSWSANQSRAIVYDVSKPESPTIVQELALDGEIADSRLVGDVLYVATSIRPDYSNGYSEQKAKGLVYSVKLGQKLAVVERVELALPTSARENMNIVEIEQNGSFQYYLVAVLSQTGWGWWDRQSLVEIVDISSPMGDIKRVMVVSAKGEIRERSQTTIKNNTLVVVSNFSGAERNDPLKIAVETFKLPTASSEIIDENEAQYRKLHIDRQLKGLTGLARDQKYAELVADAQTGLQDRFVKVSDSAAATAPVRGSAATATASLRKVVADSLVVTQSDEAGSDGRPLNASIQDVRFENNRLYVFWVPQNNRDPFDLFDFSHPESGIKYLKRLKFEGWIQRAIPVRYQNRDFVLALGHIIPAVDDGRNRRYPQAMLFEIIGNAGSERPMEVAQLTLNKGDLWADFNGRDRDVEVKFSGAGQGSLMFEVYAKQGSSYVSGGKLVHFNLEAATKGDFNQVFTEGSLLAAESSWLKRVFTNPEIERINTFSNEALATFNIGDKGAATEIGRAVHVLELARNIEAYVDLPSGDRYTQGAQIIRRNIGGAEKTLVRRVDARRADADVTEAISEAVLDGGYQAHAIDPQDGAILVATQEYRQKGEGEGRSYESVNRLYRLSTVGQKLAIATAETLVSEAGTRGRYFGGSTNGFTRLKSGEMLYRSGSELYRVGGAKTQKIAMEGCETANRKLEGLTVLGGVPYVSTVETVKDASRKNIEYSRHFIAQATLSASSVACGAAINIPGKAIALSAAGHLVTDDERFVDFKKRTFRSQTRDGKPAVEEYVSVENERALESLKITGDKASLVDDYELGEGATAQYQAIGPGRFGYFVSEQTASYGGRRMSPYYSSEPSKFVSIGFDADWTFNREVFVMPEEFLSGASFAGVVRDPSSPSTLLGVVTSGRKLQVVRWTGKANRPEIVNLSRVDAQFAKTAAATTVVLPQGYYSYFGRGLDLSYNPVLQSLQIPQNDAGVVQVYLAQ
jgi:hypothetical protein